MTSLQIKLPPFCGLISITIMKLTTSRFNLPLLAFGCVLAPHLAHAQNPQMANSVLPPLRPPSVPLVTHDPYFSIWSNSNKLYSDATRHWTGRENRLHSMVRIDGQTFRLMGAQPEESASLPQTSVVVLPTRTIYSFANERVQVQMVFLTPAIPNDLELLSRPVTYISYLVHSLDGKTHDIQFYADAGADITVNDANAQQVNWERVSQGEMTVLRLGSVDQAVLARRGDDLRIDWGYLYVAAPNIKGLQSVLGARENAQAVWGRTGNLPTSDDKSQPRNADDRSPVAALAFDVGAVGSKPVARTMMLAYDDEYSINWMGHRLRPYWRRNGMDAMGLLNVAAKDYESLNQRSIAFDNELMGRFAQRGRRKIRASGGSGASSGAGGAEDCGRCQRCAALVFQRK